MASASLCGGLSYAARTEPDVGSDGAGSDVVVQSEASSAGASDGSLAPPPGTQISENADLALSNLEVTRPADTTARTFATCNFQLRNNGPVALSSESVLVDYYLSANTTFGDADDRKIGHTALVMSTASGSSTTLFLSSTDLSDMTRF